MVTADDPQEEVRVLQAQRRESHWNNDILSHPDRGHQSRALLLKHLRRAERELAEWLVERAPLPPPSLPAYRQQALRQVAHESAQTLRNGIESLLAWS